MKEKTKTQIEQEHKVPEECFIVEADTDKGIMRLCIKCEIRQALEEQAQELRTTILEDDELVNNWIEQNTNDKLQAQRKKFEEVLNKFEEHGFNTEEPYDLGFRYAIKICKKKLKEALNNQSPQGNTILSPAGKLESDSKHFEDKAPELTKTSALYPSSQEDRGSNSCKNCKQEMYVPQMHMRFNQIGEVIGYTCQKFTPKKEGGKK